MSQPDETIRTVLETLEFLADHWGVSGSVKSDDLRDLAAHIKIADVGGEMDMCCPMCQEVVCDGGCPFEPIRKHLFA